jgi:uncharacterized protein (DUF362 family)
MKNNSKNKSGITRRDFIKATSLSAAGLSFLGSVPLNIKHLIVEKSNRIRSRIVVIKNPDVINQEGIVNTPLLTEMLEKAIIKYSGEKSAANFWKNNFSTDKTIGLKVNTLGLNSIANTTLTNHFEAFTKSIIESFNKAGISEERFIIWDRSEEELVSAGFKIQKENGNTRVLGCVETRRGDGGIGYTDEEFQVGEKKTRLAKILTDMCSSIINIPLIKDHGTAGFTGALKNHYGSINNAREFHSNNCTQPGIPEVNTIPIIREKQKLIITNALSCVFNGGPRWDRKFMWNYGGILVGTDPVAIDTVMLNIINEKRKLEGMSPISQNVAKHIRLSSEIGLGTNDINEIDLMEING